MAHSGVTRPPLGCPGVAFWEVDDLEVASVFVTACGSAIRLSTVRNNGDPGRRRVAQSGITVISDALQLRSSEEQTSQVESQAWYWVRGGAGVVLPALLARSAIRRSGAVSGHWLGG